ncbi:MAG: molybdopterin-binding protein [Clostridiales Family XIII bacterium]|jgi:hypothetical protein|nr:molybdopterin-binding protein [Clostridiales Family XIII bacterium]
MREIRTQDAVGLVLAHDVTRIIPGEMKETPFQKGHVIREEDVEPLLKMGKMHLFVWEEDASLIHENEAAGMLADLVAGALPARGEVREGKVEIFAHMDGVLRVDKGRLSALNDFDEVMVATRHDLSPVREGDKIAGTRIIPLAISWQKMQEVRATPAPVLQILPYLPLKAAVVTTGSEVFEGLVEDGFTPVVRRKLASFGAVECGHLTVPDNPDMATEAILRMKKQGADVICVTGGMSVDPDDRTPLAIKNTGARIVSYGAPVLPGAMFLLAYFEDGAAVLGLPGCVMHSRVTIFDILLPRVMAGIEITKGSLNALAAGGLCQNCAHCIYPVCGFGAV